MLNVKQYRQRRPRIPRFDFMWLDESVFAVLYCRWTNVNRSELPETMNAVRIADLDLKSTWLWTQPLIDSIESFANILIGFTPRQLRILYVDALWYPIYTHVNSTHKRAQILRIFCSRVFACAFYSSELPEPVNSEYTLFLVEYSPWYTFERS